MSWFMSKRNDGLEHSRGRAAEPTHLVDLHGVEKTYETAAGKFMALKGVDLVVDHSEFVAVLGKSGSGKSTLINMITGIDRPTADEVVMGGRAIHHLSEGQDGRLAWAQRRRDLQVAADAHHHREHHAADGLLRHLSGACAQGAALELLDQVEMAAATTEAQRLALEAAGMALLARGGHGSLGAFAGFIFSSLGTLLMGFTLLYGRAFSRLAAWIAIVGAALMAAYTSAQPSYRPPPNL